MPEKPVAQEIAWIDTESAEAENDEYFMRIKIIIKTCCPGGRRGN